MNGMKDKSLLFLELMQEEWKELADDYLSLSLEGKEGRVEWDVKKSKIKSINKASLCLECIRNQYKSITPLSWTWKKLYVIRAEKFVWMTND